ncbi:MAG: class I SAM-dependent RNA methyltransferase [Clostridia bacterium]
MDIMVAVGSGAETATKIELREMGIDAPCINGRFVFEGSGLEVAKCNLLLRTADRVYIRLKIFTAVTFDELFDNTINYPWEDIVSRRGAIIVNAKSVKSKLFALSSIQSIAKKAIVERLKKKYTHLPEDGAPHKIEISIYSDEVTIALDTSGDGLHKRGYRDLVYEAPIKETLAAAIIKLSVWTPERALIDPFAGSGTIPIEAAMAAKNIAPGINRSFLFEGYDFIDKSHLASERNLAKERIERDKPVRIAGYDINKRAIGLAVRHAKNAGLERDIHFETTNMQGVSSRYKYGVVITNPPYGERLMEEAELKELYKAFGAWYMSLDKWSLYAISGYPLFEKSFGVRADKTRRMYNANIECRLYQYIGARPPRQREDNQ